MEKNHSSLRTNINKFRNLPISAKITTVATILGKNSLQNTEKTLEAIKMRNKIVHEGFDPKTLETGSLSEAKDDLLALLNTVATLLSGPQFRFPLLISGNQLTYRGKD